MAEARRPSLGLVLGLAVVVLGFVEIHNLVQSLRSHTRLSDLAIRTTREAVFAARPRLSAMLAPGGQDALAEAVRDARSASLAAEVEAFDLSGQRLFALPASSSAERSPPDRLTPEGLRMLEGERVLTLGPVAGGDMRLSSYAMFRWGSERVVLRFATQVPGLIDDLRDRRQLFIGHAAALALLLLIGALALFSGRDANRPAPRGALNAYEEAMERLRDRGQELSREHAAERQRMEDAIRDKEALARAGELAAGIVHELRNGLGTIMGYARLLEKSAVSPDVTEGSQSILEECATLETVIRRFMDFVKRETLSLSPFDLGRTLSRVVARESRSRPGGKVELHGASAAGPLTGDEEMLERAFENLVRNAREAAGVGGHVRVETARDAVGGVKVTVTDDGPGLSEETRQSALRPFFTTKAGGLGLGLPIALKIIHLHEGVLRLAEASPHGLVVTVTLPAAGPALTGVLPEVANGRREPAPASTD